MLINDIQIMQTYVETFSLVFINHSNSRAVRKHGRDYSNNLYMSNLTFISNVIYIIYLKDILNYRFMIFLLLFMLCVVVNTL